MVDGSHLIWFTDLRFFHESVLELNDLWKAYLLSFASQWKQLVWTYDVARTSELILKHCPGVHIMNADQLIEKEILSDLQEKKLPMQHIKDIIHTKALYEYGGWWADLDIIWLAPITRLKSCSNLYDVLLFTELERDDGCYQKGAARIIRLQMYDDLLEASDNPVKSKQVKQQASTVNMGFMFAVRESMFLKSILNEWLGFWKRNSDAWTKYSGKRADPRKNPHWCYHQESLQASGARHSRVHICAAVYGYPWPRWLQSFPRTGAPVRLYNSVIPSLKEICVSSLAVNLWENVWSSAMIAEGISVLKGFQAKRMCPEAHSIVLDDERLCREVAQAIQQALVCLSEIGVPMAMSCRILAVAHDLVQIRHLPVLKEAIVLNSDLEPRQVNSIACVLLQIGIKMEWTTHVNDPMVSMNFVLRRIHAWYGVLHTLNHSRSVRLIDCIFARMHAVGSESTSSAFTSALAACHGGPASHSVAGTHAIAS